MTDAPNRNHWLIAAWPGMGNVAVIAAGYLIQKLGLRPIDELPAGGHFDVQAVEVKKGVIATPTTARGVFYRSDQPLAAKSPMDLTVFGGDAQPTLGVFAYANTLLDRARSMGVQRVVTFASMASQLHPSQDPRVFGAATSPELLDELRKLEVNLLEEGQIGGLNGVILGAAAQRGMAGVCLMGEIPFFAAAVPNPKAARAVLDAFCLLTGIEVDFEELTEHAKTIDEALLRMLEKMERAAAGEEGDEEEGEAEGEAPAGGGEGEKGLDTETLQKIERLFEQAHKDRSRAMALKKELDRLGVFKKYENRFLDLFKRAE